MKINRVFIEKNLNILYLVHPDSSVTCGDIGNYWFVIQESRLGGPTSEI